MLNAFRHLTPSFITYRGLKPGWKFWWKRDSRILFSSQNQIESLSRPGLLCPISLESIWFRVMRRSKCLITPGVTHLSFWEQPLVMERHVLHYEYKWADLSFSRNNWICYIYIYIYIGMVIAWYRHIQQVCKALALKLDYPQWRIQGRGASPPPPPPPLFYDQTEAPYLTFWILHWPLLDVLSTFGLRTQSCMYLVGGYWTYW